MRMLRGVWVPCWGDVAGLAAAPFEAPGADSVSWITGVVSWLLRGVCVGSACCASGHRSAVSAGCWHVYIQHPGKHSRKSTSHCPLRDMLGSPALAEGVPIVL